MSEHPSAIGAASAGLRYQVRFFWRKALPMLYATHVAKVVVEHRGVKAVDDVVVFYVPPGMNDRGVRIRVDFHQVKFHVGQTGVVDHDVVIDPAWTGTRECMLRRFCNAWKALRPSYANVRLHLVTNWPWDASSPVRTYLRDGGHLDDAFFLKGPTSTVGKIRASWQKACDLGDEDFRDFAKTLRFSTSEVSQGEAEEWLRDRCQLAGLAPIDPSVDWSAYDDLGKRLIENGKSEHTPSSLRKLVSEQRLICQASPPFKSTFAVRSFRRFAHVPAADGACVVDLTDLFDERRALSDTVWSAEIPKRLGEAISEIARLDQPVQVAFDVHLSIAWYVGNLLNPKAGIPVLLRQRVKNKPIELWDVSASRRSEEAQDWLPIHLQPVTRGRDLAIVVSVTHAALEDATRAIGSLPIGNVLHFTVLKPGPHAIRDGAHARWLADELVARGRATIAEVCPKRIHLFLACPASFAFLLGQDANSLGPTTVYEFSFGDPTRNYRPGMATQ